MTNINRVKKYSKKSKPTSSTVLLLGLLGVITLFVTLLVVNSNAVNLSNLSEAGYNPKIVPGKFTTNITNRYFTLTPGKKMVYEKETTDGTERVEILVTDKTRKIMGVTTLVYWDRVWLDGELIEDTRDYLAQNIDTQDVWYFGEEVDNYENGQLVDNAGSWIAGVDGAKPGIWIKGSPRVGDEYRQEYYKGEAEDMVKVLSVKEKVKVPYGRYSNCVKTYDWTPLDPDAKENKYYCPGVRALALEVDLNTGEKLELVDVKLGSHDSDEDSDTD